MWLAKAHTQWSILALLAISLAGCAPSNGLKPGSGIQPVDFTLVTSTIATIKQPAQVNATVQIKGRVNNRAPLLGKTTYELQDQTGSIWVLATDPIPNIGDEVVLNGKLVYRSIPLNGKDQGSFYIEQQQLQSRPALKSDRGGMREEG